MCPRPPSSVPACSRRQRGIRNVAFECADAQDHHLAPGHFDVAISRFGTMFFDDPAAAFGNIGRALRADGRLVMVVWQAPDRNEWDVAIRRALGGSLGPAAIVPGTETRSPSPTRRPCEGLTTLRAPGFDDIGLFDVQEPIYYGPDWTGALDWVRASPAPAAPWSNSTAPAQRNAGERVRQALGAHNGDDGVWFGARAGSSRPESGRRGSDIVTFCEGVAPTPPRRTAPCSPGARRPARRAQPNGEAGVGDGDQLHVVEASNSMAGLGPRSRPCAGHRAPPVTPNARRCRPGPGSRRHNGCSGSEPPVRAGCRR